MSQVLSNHYVKLLTKLSKSKSIIIILKCNKSLFIMMPLIRSIGLTKEPSIKTKKQSLMNFNLRDNTQILIKVKSKQ